MTAGTPPDPSGNPAGPPFFPPLLPGPVPDSLPPPTPVPAPRPMPLSEPGPHRPRSPYQDHHVLLGLCPCPSRRNQNAAALVLYAIYLPSTTLGPRQAAETVPLIVCVGGETCQFSRQHGRFRRPHLRRA